MIDPVFKKYFNQPINDLEDRKIRVWQKVYAHIRYEMNEAEVPQARHYGILPLAVSLALVVLGITALNVFSHSLPGDKLYSVKRAVEKAQMASAPTAEVKSKLQITFIEKRTEEIKKLENKTGGKLTARQQAKVDDVNTEVGKTVLSLIEKESLVTTADAKVVGEAVTEFLKSTPLTGKEKEDKLKEIVTTVIATTPVETEEPNTAEEEPVAEPAAEEPKEEAKQPGVIQGEVDSEDITVQ